MRILVISDLPQFVTGGAEKQAAHLIEAWMDAGHDVTCYGRRMGAGPVRIGRYDLPVRRIHTIQRLGRLMRAGSYFVSLCVLLLRYRGQFDVIYTRFLGEAALTVSVLKRLRWLRVALIATPANTGGKGDANFLLSLPCARWFIRLLDSQCDVINLIAPAMADELRGIGFLGHNFTQIPNGVLVRSTLPKAEERCNSFIGVGRVVPQKGYDILIEAMSRIKERLAPGLVRIAGCGPELKALESLAARRGVSDAIIWLGELGHDAVIAELGRARVFLLPSRYEGMSNAGLEGMERGLVMIITRCGGLDSYIQPDMGWVVEAGDAQALARALEVALSKTPQELSAMGARNRDLILREFDIKTVATRYLTLFQELIEARRGKRSP